MSIFLVVPLSKGGSSGAGLSTNESISESAGVNFDPEKNLSDQ